MKMMPFSTGTFCGYLYFVHGYLLTDSLSHGFLFFLFFLLFIQYIQ